MGITWTPCFFLPPESKMSKIVLITGASRSLGLAITTSLLSSSPSGSTIYLTSRSPAAGHAALASIPAALKTQSTVQYLPLDITDDKSIDAVAAVLQVRHGRLDVLVNNAGVELDIGAKAEGMGRDEVVRRTLATNYYGPLRASEKLLPLIPPGGRIVFVSSTAGHLNNFGSDRVRAQIANPNLTREGLTQLVARFADGEKGWPRSAYCASKAAQTALAGVLARERPDIAVNACCPGWVDTEMGRHAGRKPPKTCEEGARIPVRLAVGDIGDVNGKFWENKDMASGAWGEVAAW